ncbi:PD-(D/E)XK nuclease family protein [Stackebrandtia soli]|uniref:RecB family exonuclease n=1 Tax=Stackebrandtia soli TaxID=1892856 RepID=UPI0039E873E0
MPTPTTATSASAPDAAPTATPPSALSPSRASDFKTCPLLYRLRAIDRIPEPTTPAQVKGTLVHSVLERLYDLEAYDRTTTAAVALLEPEWSRLKTDEHGLTDLFDDPAAETAWLSEARRLVEAYFDVEDPTRLAPADRERLVEVTVADDVPLRGFIDRVDVAPTGQVRVVDYKTGKAPGPAFQAQALFQLKFYALVLWRLNGVVPAMLRLLYLKDRQVIDYAPTEDELRGVERTVVALWRAITTAAAAGDFPPRKNPLCNWCAHQTRCPEFGGTPPPYPLPTAVPGA